MSKIICIGSLAKDIFFPTAEGKIIDNSKDPTQKQLLAFELGAKYSIEDRFEALGGCAANVSLGLAKLSIAVSTLGRVGQDNLGKEIIETLNKNNVGTDLVQIDEEAKSDLSLILVNKNNGERTIFFNRDANENMVVDKNLLQSENLLVSALNGDWKRNMEEILSLIEKNKSNIFYNPGQANMKEDLEMVKKFIQKSQVLILNQDEAIEILGKEESPEEMLTKLSAMGPKTVAITLGEEGACGINQGDVIKIAGKKVQATDSTGAGDAFTAAFTAAYIQGKGFEKAVKWGVVNGTNVVQFYGATQGLLSEIEIKEKIKLL